MSKYKNKYRIESNRKPNWDYSNNGIYFLTIITQNRVCNLGKIKNQEMILSDFGKIVEQEWFQSFEIRKELILDEFIIMPNHLHAIVIIDNVIKPNDTPVETHGRASLSSIDGTSIDNVDGTSIDIIDGTSIDIIDVPSISSKDVPSFDDNLETHVRASLQNIKRNMPIRLPKSISSFIAGFKSSVNSKIDDYIDDNQLTIPKYNKNNHFFQPNYHDHIIRNENEYINIKKYIRENPTKWDKDTLG